MTSISNADTFYVATTGDDNNNGSLSSPWRIVGHAWRNSGGGDTVLDRERTYSEGQIWLHMNT